MVDTALDARLRDQIRLLSVFHYVFAALALLGIGFLVLHGYFMHMMMSPAFMKGQPNPPPAEFLRLFVWFYVVFAALLIVGGVINLLAAGYLRTYRHRTFCMVVAGLNCLQMPLGTILGVFTLVTLARDEARIAFGSLGGVTHRDVDAD